MRFGFAAAPAAVAAAFKKLRRVPLTTMTGRLLLGHPTVNDGRARLDSDAALRQYLQRALEHMANAGDRPVGRRKFLSDAAAGAAGLAATPHAGSATPAHALAQDQGHQAVPSDVALRVKALESILVEKGMVDPATIDAVIDTYESKIGPRNGARVVARAWLDPAYRKRLLADGTATIAELGYGGAQGEHMVVVENTPTVHNLVVCTLCSCYPWPVLGLPPTWYKSAPYRSRAVIDPRGVLKEFGVTLAEDVQVRVWDSTAEIRYLVLPERPPGTDGMTEEQLAALVTRNAMVGVAKVSRPGGATA